MAKRTTIEIDQDLLDRAMQALGEATMRATVEEALRHALEGPMQRNITLVLDEDLIRKARVLAARRNLSVSALLSEELSRLVIEDETYETAKRATLRRLERGTHLGGGSLPSRVELYDRT